MQIDRRTAKRWRDQLYINFIKTPGGKIRYLQRHIDEFDKRGEKNARKRR
jgi:predicted site-specific integrase-resolvase